MKWVAALGVVVIALLVLIWVELRSPAEAAIATKPTEAPQAIATEIVKKHEMAAIGAKIAQSTAPAADGKVSKASDEFFYRFTELVPKKTDAAAAKCYTGGLDRVHRNDKTKLLYHTRIKDGEVTIYDVKVSDESTITNKQLEDCFVREVAATHWHDDSLPDYDDTDELIIRPERGMKKYTEENMKYEGSGPDFTHHPSQQAKQ